MGLEARIISSFQKSIPSLPEDVSALQKKKKHVTTHNSQKLYGFSGKALLSLQDPVLGERHPPLALGLSRELDYLKNWAGQLRLMVNDHYGEQLISCVICLSQRLCKGHRGLCLASLFLLSAQIPLNQNSPHSFQLTCTGYTFFCQRAGVGKEVDLCRAQSQTK